MRRVQKDKLSQMTWQRRRNNSYCYCLTHHHEVIQHTGFRKRSSTIFSNENLYVAISSTKLLVYREERESLKESFYGA